MTRPLRLSNLLSQLEVGLTDNDPTDLFDDFPGGLLVPRL